jgi:hypothetical protein
MENMTKYGVGVVVAWPLMRYAEGFRSNSFCVAERLRRYIYRRPIRL